MDGRRVHHGRGVLSEGRAVRPIFKYDPVRGALLVWLEVGRVGDDRLFAVHGAACPADYVRVAPGAEPPLYVPPIDDAELFALVCMGIESEA